MMSSSCSHCRAVVTLLVSAVQILKQNWSYEIWVSALSDVLEATHERHPFFVKHILAIGHVGRDVASDRITKVLSTMRVKFTTGIPRGLLSATPQYKLVP